ncbi:hypothetical protein ACG2F4_04635 [Halalkalibaculum sp. DA3122]|uniref:hypothetical protein n=1 Tax=Halalkalibaculum sp. DA3122 TaxID=3373607 RepID=UPI003754D537
MKDSFSKEETIQILERALTAKDRRTDKLDADFNFTDIQAMAEEFGISGKELQKAAAEVTQTKEQNRDQLYPEVISTRWIDGQLNNKQIEDFFAGFKIQIRQLSILVRQTRRNSYHGKNQRISAKRCQGFAYGIG